MKVETLTNIYGIITVLMVLLWLVTGSAWVAISAIGWMVNIWFVNSKHYKKMAGIA